MPSAADSQQASSSSPGPWGLSVVERRSTTDQVLAELRAAIISGRIRSHEPLREAALARTLGTGRSAIREAVRQLVQEGLVEYRLNRGCYVRTLSVEDSNDVYLAREAIEIKAVERAVECSRELDLGPLRAAFARIVAAAEATGADDTPGPDLIAADLDFHREIVRLGGSPRLTRAHETLAAEAQMLLHHQPVYPPTDYTADHRVLLDAIERRDPEAPERVCEHLRLSATLIAGELERLSEAAIDNEERSRSDGGTTA